VRVDLTVEDLRRLFDARVEPNNEYVHHKALVLASKYPGSHNIKQICSIFEYLKDGDSSTRSWSYVNEARGEDFYGYANYTLRVGEEAGCTGAGDCDDFAILMSSLIESVGGTTRVIFSTNDSRGEAHAYTEVYIGTLGDPDSEVIWIIGWLMQKYSTRKIFGHIDTNTKDVWLNLDWSASHPGGHFYEENRHVLILIRNDALKTRLKAPDDYLPPA